MIGGHTERGRIGLEGWGMGYSTKRLSRDFVGQQADGLIE